MGGKFERGSDERRTGHKRLGDMTWKEKVKKDLETWSKKNYKKKIYICKEYRSGRVNVDRDEAAEKQRETNQR